MGRLTTLIWALVLVVAACGGAASPPATPAPATATPAAATAAPTTPGPTATAAQIAVQVTFDGKNCTYAGPSTVPAGAVLVWTYANTPPAVEGYGSALVVAPVVDGTTWEQILVYLAGESRASVVPDWLTIPEAGQGEIKLLFDDSAAAGGTLQVKLTRDAYYVGCNTNVAGGDKAFPALLLQVMKG